VCIIWEVAKSSGRIDGEVPISHHDIRDSILDETLSKYI
jgi:hypothetical protein